MYSGPVAQLRPIPSNPAYSSDTTRASEFWPASIVPIGSMVPDTMIGNLSPNSRRASSVPIRAALTFRVSWHVSSSSKSECSAKARACSRYEEINCSYVIPPVTLIDLVEGPIAPATNTGRPGLEYSSAVSRASRPGLEIDLRDPVPQPILGQHDVCGAEGVRLDDVGTGLAIGGMDSAHDVRPRENTFSLQPLERRPPEIVGSQVCIPAASVPIAPSSTRMRSARASFKVRMRLRRDCML